MKTIKVSRTEVLLQHVWNVLDKAEKNRQQLSDIGLGLKWEVLVDGVEDLGAPSGYKDRNILLCIPEAEFVSNLVAKILKERGFLVRSEIENCPPGIINLKIEEYI